MGGVMNSKKISRSHRQIGDQTTKGGLLGIFIYVLSRNNVDPVLIGLLVPVVASALAWISTKIGDPDLACMFIPGDKKAE
jgi:cytochrome c biogenesis factor